MQAYMGQFLREYEHRRFSLLEGLRIFGFFPSAVITMAKRFPDISFYQGVVDFNVMRAQADAVIIRAGQNVWTDPQFARSYAEAKRVGMKRGVYWFYDDRIAPSAQAEILVGMLRDDLPEMEVIADWENTYGGPYSKIEHVVQFMQLVEDGLPDVTVGVYTGYYWFKDHSSATANPSAYQYLRGCPLWLAWYTSDPANVLIPAPWSALTHWQFGTPAEGTKYGVESNEIDMNYFNGTAADFAARYGGASPIPQPGDEMIQTQAGVNCHRIRRFETDCYIHVIDLAQVRTKIILGFDTVPHAVAANGASLGFNMGGWGDLVPSYKPDEYLVIDGVVKQEQMTGSGWIDISRDNKITIDDVHPNFPARWNLWGFDRLIARHGTYNPLITNPYAEPRTINGRDRSGRLVILVCEGRQANQKGLTFPEAWSVMQEFDVSDCGNADGGYSSAVVNTYFPAPLLNSTYLEENRPVVSQLLFFSGDGEPMAYRYNAKSSTNRALRNNHAVSADRTGDIPAGTIVYGNDLFVAVKEITYNGAVIQRIGDKWLHVLAIGTQPVDGWTAIIHMGAQQMALTDTGVTPPPTEPVLTHTIEVFSDGSIKVDGIPHA